MGKTAEQTDDLVTAMETVARLGAKRKVAEFKLREACALVAERLVVAIGEACPLPQRYRIVNLDPRTHLYDAPPRMPYLVLVDVRETGKGTKTHALSKVPSDAQDSFDFPPAGRLTLTRFAEAVQNGLLIDIANSIDIKTDRIAELIAPTEKTAKDLL